MVPVIAIVGKSGTGKTVIMEQLIKEFKARGYRVGAIKHAQPDSGTRCAGQRHLALLPGRPAMLLAASLEDNYF